MKTAPIKRTGPGRHGLSPTGTCQAQSTLCRHLVMAIILLAGLFLAACGSPAPADQDQSPLPTGTPATVEEATVPPSAKSPLATGTAGPQSATTAPTQPLPTATLEAREATTVPSSPPRPTPPDSSMPRLVQQAQKDLAQRLGVAEAEVTVQSVEAVEWPDGSLGCPLPGAAYPQVVTPGYRVVLEAEGKTYDYHTDAGRLVILCGENDLPSLPVIPVNPGEIQDGIPWMPVDDPVPTQKP